MMKPPFGRYKDDPDDEDTRLVEPSLIPPEATRGDSHTELLSQSERAEIPGPYESADDSKTRIVSEIKLDQAGAKPGSVVEDPPVGWLVVIAGPGKGKAVQIGSGVNKIGRDSSQRICLDFGDNLISHEEQAIVTYDPQGRNFYLQHDKGKNITYLATDSEKKPVLTPTEISLGDEISIGETLLRFVPLCGPEFDWLN
jgi:hypothetical protein